MPSRAPRAAVVPLPKGGFFSCNSGRFQARTQGPEVDRQGCVLMILKVTFRMLHHPESGFAARHFSLRSLLSKHIHDHLPLPTGHRSHHSPCRRGRRAHGGPCGAPLRRRNLLRRLHWRRARSTRDRAPSSAGRPRQHRSDQSPARSLLRRAFRAEGARPARGRTAPPRVSVQRRSEAGHHSGRVARVRTVPRVREHLGPRG